MTALQEPVQYVKPQEEGCSPLGYGHTSPLGKSPIQQMACCCICHIDQFADHTLRMHEWANRDSSEESQGLQVLFPFLPSQYSAVPHGEHEYGDA
jgi:hypothetical protein